MSMYRRARHFTIAVRHWLLILSCAVSLLLLGTMQRSSLLREAALTHAAKEIAPCIAELRRELYRNTLSDRSSARNVLEYFRSAHPRIAAIRLRDGQGRLIGRSGFISWPNRPVRLEQHDMQLSIIPTASGTLVIAATRLRVSGRAAGQVSVSETAALEVATFIHPHKVELALA